MKTIKILVLVSMLTVTQSFAFSKTQRNVLLGIGAGAIVVHALESRNSNSYEDLQTNVVYVDSHKSYNKHVKYKKRHMRKHNKRNHHRYSRHRGHNPHYVRDNHRYDSIAMNRHYRRSCDSRY